MAISGELKKISGETITQLIDYSDRLPSGVSVSSATASAVRLNDGAVDGTVLGTVSNTASSVSFVATAGTDGLDYLVTVSATLSNSDVLKDLVLMSVRDRAI